MKKPAHVLEIFLQPGELWFGDRNTRLRTILGSCVTMTLWHPQLQVGGMCHYMLPARTKTASEALDGRYGDEAIEMLLAEVRATTGQVQEFEAKLFGGGHMFNHARRNGRYAGVQISDRNIDAGREQLVRHGFKFVAEHVGGQGHREVIFNIWNGHVWVKHAPLPMTRAAAPGGLARISPVVEV